MSDYTPSPRVAEILNYAMARIKSVPYRPSGRWLFYQIYQRYGLKKGDSKKLDKWTSRARKARWNGWHPDILSDSIRKAEVRGRGSDTPEEALENMRGIGFVFDKILSQDYYVEIWFEAAAMQEQFKSVTEGLYVTLVPFRGDASIPFKWEIAQRLEEVYFDYDKPIVILYFGDYDLKGMSIPESALRDIRAWCGEADFEFIRCGINDEQVEFLDIPENPEKPGTYQWEALEDGQARTLILDNLAEYWDRDEIQKVYDREVKLEEFWHKKINPLIDEMIAQLED